MVGTAGLPHVIVRFYTVPRVAAARISADWALVFIALLYTTASSVAAFARANLLNTVSDAPCESVPTWFSNWESTGLINFEDKNRDGRIQCAGPQSDEVNELTIDRDIMVLANPEIARLANWILGLVAAGGLAAALSTAAGLLPVISTAVAHDLLKCGFSHSMTERRELITARIAGYFGINPPGFVAQVVAFAFGLAAASFFPAIIMGIFSRRMNKEGAITGMVLGITFTAGYIVYFKFLHPELNNSGHWWWGISPKGIGTLGMLLNFVSAWLVSRFTPRPVREMVDRIRIPRGAGKAHELSV